MRRMLRSQSLALLQSEKKLHKALSLRQLLDRNGISPQWFVNTLHRRWGNSIDLIVAAHMMEKNIQLVDIRSAKPILTVWAGKSDDRLHQVGHGRYHFVVGATRVKEAPKSWLSYAWQQLKRCARAGVEGVMNAHMKVREGAGQRVSTTQMWPGQGKTRDVEWSMSTRQWGSKMAETVQNNERKIHTSDVRTGIRGTGMVESSNVYKDLLSNEYSQRQGGGGTGKEKMGKVTNNEYKVLPGNVYTQQSNVYKILSCDEYSQRQGSNGNDEEKMEKVQNNEYKDLSGRVCTQKRNNADSLMC
eukprot:5853718-Amphidinium_carterae.1